MTRSTITDPAVLEDQIGQIRDASCAGTPEEMSLGACSLPAPVRDPDHQAVASPGLTVARLTGAPPSSSAPSPSPPTASAAAWSSSAASPAGRSVGRVTSVPSPVPLH